MTSCSRISRRGAVMATTEEGNLEATIGIRDNKQFNSLLEDVRGTSRSCFFSGGGGDNFQPEMFPQYQYENHELPQSTSQQPAYPGNIPPVYTPVPSSDPHHTVSPQPDLPPHYNHRSPGFREGSMSPIVQQYSAHLPTIPSTAEYPGELGFCVSFGPPTESASKSATWTYSEKCKKLYVNLASFCPIKFKTTVKPPPGSYLRGVAVFKGSTNLHDIVKRCPNHMETSQDGQEKISHFMRSNNPSARYNVCPESGRHSILIPYTGPQVGTEFVTEMFAFMCFSSCPSGPSRRPVEIIFTLEKDGQTLGRQVVEIRVCACPGRDRKSDEKLLLGEASTTTGGKRKRGPGKGRLKRLRAGSDDEEELVITTRDRRVYDILMSMKTQLEESFIYGQEAAAPTPPRRRRLSPEPAPHLPLG
ncbi:cellular tumor antigen p53 isoform X3 [Nematostella vectensis]|uniref:cellular tumor antigen p53 isoform X3 n=1 Tax=Nematostella vectensis TaxID=45351 RepID=UPI0013903B1B|nr:cellular tumor antigen p53 isoform X3 [Nematostella vectensis]